MDLKSLNILAPAESGTEVELEHPATREPLVDDKGTPWIIEVRGEDSETVRRVIKKQHDKRMDRARKGQKGGSDADLSESEQVQKLVAATIGWSGLVMDGEPYPFNAQNAHRLYSDPGFYWIVEQVQQAMSDRARFFTNGSKS